MLGALVLAVGGATFGLGPEWQPVMDPLADARAGKIYCEMPDHLEKTCEGTVSFHFTEGEATLTVRRQPVSNDPPVSLIFGAAIWLEDGAICMRPGKGTFTTMRLVLKAEHYVRPAGEEFLAEIRKEMESKFLGKKICEHHFVNGDRFLSVATIDGQRAPYLDSSFVWQATDERYILWTWDPVDVE